MESPAMKIEIEQEVNGRWIADAVELPGVMAYGAARDEAVRKVETLALRVIADRLELGDNIPEVEEVFSIVP